MLAYADGACRKGNPGQCSCAWAVFNGEGPVLSGSRYLGPENHTNNYAEYQGLLDCLKFVTTINLQNMVIHCDSQLVVKQVNGVWGVKHKELQPLRDLAYALLTRGNHTLCWVRGHNGDPGNELVERLCNETLDRELNEKLQ